MTFDQADEIYKLYQKLDPDDRGRLLRLLSGWQNHRFLIRVVAEYGPREAVKVFNLIKEEDAVKILLNSNRQDIRRQLLDVLTDSSRSNLFEKMTEVQLSTWEGRDVCIATPGLKQRFPELRECANLECCGTEKELRDGDWFPLAPCGHGSHYACGLGNHNCSNTKQTLGN